MKTHNFVMTNADTDSISFCKENGEPFSKLEQESLLNEINQILPNLIEYEHDGMFDKVLVLKAKNYVLVEGEKVKKKGSSITDSKKEQALMEMIEELIDSLLNRSGKELDIYHRYIKEVLDIQDIKRWSVKKNVTESVLNPERSNESKVLDALDGLEIQEGDKYYMYTAVDGVKQKIVKGEPQFNKKGEPTMVKNAILKLPEEWDNDEDIDHYLKRVYNIIEILQNVLDIEQFIKYYNKCNKKYLENL